MKRTKWLLIGLLVLASAGCAGRDWVSDLLVLTDVTGTWEGSLIVPFSKSFRIVMVLQQRGPKVTGEFSHAYGAGELEGVVSGEVLSISRGPMKGELTVDGDEMMGTGSIPNPGGGSLGCPCQLRLRRERSRVSSMSEPGAR